MRAWPLSVLLMIAACAPRATGDIVPVALDSAEAGDLANNLLLVDKSERKLTLYRDGAAIFTVDGLAFGDAPVGHKAFEGDERTPEGLYRIDARNPNSKYHLSLRVSYPNEADRTYAAAAGRSPGGDIFLHGQPNGWIGPQLPGDWTDGCIAMGNDDIERLYTLIADGTPILIRP